MNGKDQNLTEQTALRYFLNLETIVEKYYFFLVLRIPFSDFLFTQHGPKEYYI